MYARRFCTGHSDNSLYGGNQFCLMIMADVNHLNPFRTQ